MNKVASTVAGIAFASAAAFGVLVGLNMPQALARAAGLRVVANP